MNNDSPGSLGYNSLCELTGIRWYDAMHLKNGSIDYSFKSFENMDKPVELDDYQVSQFHQHSNYLDEMHNNWD